MGSYHAVIYSPCFVISDYFEPSPSADEVCSNVMAIRAERADSLGMAGGLG